MTHTFLIELTDEVKGYEDSVYYFERVYGAEEFDIAEHDKQVRAEVVEKFFNNIKKYCRTSSCIGCRFCDDETCEIAVIKEQLKGAENE